MKGKIKKVLGFGILGFILGLLFAPQKGDETRKSLLNTIKDWKDKCKCSDENNKEDSK